MDKRKESWPVWIGMALAAAVILYGIWHIYDTTRQYEEADKEYEKVRDMAVKEQEADEDDKEDGGDKTVKPPITVDIAALKKENPDTVGWIYYPAVGINYPIMQDKDNKYYMNHTFKGEKNAAGSIFLDTAGSAEFTDENTMVYGHNMRNGSMFGALKNIRNEGMAEENPYIWVFLESGNYRYRICSWHDAKTTDDSFRTKFETEEEKKAYIQHISELAEEKTGRELKPKDKILTLSTCTSDSSVRFLVHGVLEED